MVKIDLVRKSSGGIEERFNEEMDRAADRKARKEAVKLDLNADFKGLNGNRIPDSRSCFGDSSKTLKSNCSIPIRGPDSG
jgi:hypothetical protein